jgi:hypothetical protein
MKHITEAYASVFRSLCGPSGLGSPVRSTEENMARSDPALKRAILDALSEMSKSVVGSNDRALRDLLGLKCSVTKFSRALGSLITAGKVRRHRPRLLESGGEVVDRQTTIWVN